LPYLSEIRLFPYDNIPPGWHLCDGSFETIGHNNALFSLIGTTYGGDGTKTFAYPDLRGRTPVGTGTSNSGVKYGLGEAGGAETVALDPSEMPAHRHSFQVSSQPGTATGTVGAIYAQVAQPAAANIYGPISPAPVAIDPATVVPAGGGKPHDNMQPYLAMVYCICTVGDYPTRGP